MAADGEYLTFRLESEEYAIDIMQVQEIRAHEAVTRIANAPEFVKGVINLRGTIVPIVDLRKRFGLADSGAGVPPVVVILNVARRMVGVAVDAVSDVIGLTAQQIRPAPALGGTLAEGCIRGIAPVEERMLIVFDIARLVMGDHVEGAEAQAA